MLDHDQHAELLHQYWERLRIDPAATPPAELDPGLALLARELEAQVRPPEPDDAFATQLRRRLEAEATVTSPNGRGTGLFLSWPRLRFPTLATGWPWAGFAAVAVLILALLGAMFWTMGPQTVSAQEILAKAQATATHVAEGGVESFVLTEVTRSRPTARAKAEAGYTDDEQLQTETTQWYEAPNRWRIETTGTVIGPDGQAVPDRTSRMLNVSDGTDHWSYDPLHKSGQVQRLDPALNGTGGVTRFGLDASGLSTVLARASKCGTPMLKGTETVAGRSAYVIDLGPSKCPYVDSSELNGASTLWVDKETFFVLKVVQYSGTNGRLLSTTEVTSIQYNVPIDPTHFSFTPPPDAKIQDSRPQPTPSADLYQQQLTQFARQVDFPLFAARAAPSGLVPLQPRLDDAAGPQVQLGYVPSDEVGKATTAGPTGVQITEQKASYDLIDRWTQQAQSTTIAGGQGWLRRGRKVNGGSTDSAAIVLRGGTLISVTSGAVSADELLRIAGSLALVPGSHPPLPDPTPPTLAEIRQRVSFAVFVPTWVPAGLTPEPPVGGEQPTQNVEIRYHTADGGIGLAVMSGRPDCCSGYASLPSEPVALPNGLEGHLIRTPTTLYGGLTLWWQQDGTTIALTGPAVSESDLVKIAASLSKTAKP